MGSTSNSAVRPDGRAEPCAKTEIRVDGRGSEETEFPGCARRIRPCHIRFRWLVLGKRKVVACENEIRVHPGRSLSSSLPVVVSDFDAEYERLQAALWRYVHRLVGDPDVADDVVQEA